MKRNEEKGITLIALMITIIVLLILAGVTLSLTLGEKGIFNVATNAIEQTKIENYKEKIELIKGNILLQNKEFEEPTIQQIKEELDSKENETWVGKTQIIMDKEIEKLKLITKDGYIFYITGNKTEYKGKGEVVDTSELQKDDVLEMKPMEKTQKGQLVRITNLSGKEYYKIEYQIESKEGKWKEIQSGEMIEVEYGKTIYARLIYGIEAGIIQEVSIGHTTPNVVAKNIDTSNIKRKTEIPVAELFEKTWGSDGTGTTEYSVTGSLKFNKTSFNSLQINNISELELGVYTLTCKITSPTGKEAIAQKEIQVTTLANDMVTNEDNEPFAGYAIYSSYDLAEFRDMVNKGASNINAKQKQNIDLNVGKWITNENGITTFSTNAIQWAPIGITNYNIDTNQYTNTKSFNGIYDGANKEINGLYINNEAIYWAGLFGYSEKSTIKNIILKNSSISNYIGAGGILGKGNSVKIINCKNYANIRSSFCIGGMCGAGDSIENTEMKIENCENYGKIEQVKNINKDGSCYGGIAGFINGSINKCKNYGIVVANLQNEQNYYVGVAGITGFAINAEIVACSNVGKITSVGACVGGIVGYSRINVVGEKTIISTCFNTGSIDTIKSLAGGIIAWSDTINIENCYNKGSVSGENAGGIARWIGYKDTISIIKNCYEVSNNIQGTKSSHLIIDDYEGTLINNYIKGDITKAVGQGGKDIIVTVSQVQTKTIEDFKKASTNITSVTYLLNGNKSTGTWAQGKVSDKLINDGYPYLVNNYTELEIN